MTAVVTRWWWIRHAPVTSDEGRIYGQRDLPCDCSDDATFRWLAATLPENAVLLTSDLRRTIATADAIAGAGLDLAEAVREPALREQSFGDWQGVHREDFAKIHNRLPHRFWLSAAYERPPGGESFMDVVARVVPVIVRMSAEYEGRDIIAVAHGGTIRAALAFALDISPEAALAFSIENCSVTRLDHITNIPEGSAWRAAMVNRLGKTASG